MYVHSDIYKLFEYMILYNIITVIKKQHAAKTLSSVELLCHLYHFQTNRIENMNKMCWSVCCFQVEVELRYVHCSVVK